MVRTVNINNRRYLGNKYKLLPFIKETVASECGEINSVVDIFAGTGAVASAFQDKQIITNDIMYSNYICNYAWFSPTRYNEKKLTKIIESYNKKKIHEDNYMTDNFSDTYFSREDCSKIGFIREDIEQLYLNKKINKRERALLIASLLYAMDKIAKTCGHYDAYRQGVEFDEHLELCLPLASQNNNKKNKCFNEDSNILANKIKADLVYLDPPYNSRQYSDAYHLLENVACWKKPDVFGVAKKMDRSNLKSRYCTKDAEEAFSDLIKSLDCKYILLSYNNMAKKGNDRSNARISDEALLTALKSKGTVKVFSENYKAFTTGKSEIADNQERLFLCVCNQHKEKYLQSPLNYTGGKYKLLPQIIPLFPKGIGTFIDLFCGGCNVGINVSANRHVYNDNNHHLIRLFELMQRTNVTSFLSDIDNLIQDFSLSDTKIHGYSFYGCDSNKGLGNYNRKGFNELRDTFNKRNYHDDLYYIMLYVLIVYAFNNQIRFNDNGEFNLPVGKRDFNKNMKEKLISFVERLKNQDSSFTCLNFREMDINTLKEGDFVYADPPYLITCASYNENSGWTEKDERDLLNYLDTLSEKNIKFALSNVIEAKGRTNEILKTWIESRPEYKLIDLDFSYNNANYHKKNKTGVTKEVLIINY